MRFALIFITVLQTQVHRRQDVLRFLAELCKELDLSNIILYTAVDYFDRFCADQEISGRFFAAISVACLLIASKIDGGIQNPLRISQILDAVRFPMRRKDVLACEHFVLYRLEWRLRVSTILHHANRLHSIGMFTELDRISSSPASPLADDLAAVQRITNDVRYFCDLLLLDRCEVGSTKCSPFTPARASMTPPHPA